MAQNRDPYGRWAGQAAPNAGGAEGADPEAAASWPGTREALFKNGAPPSGSAGSMPSGGGYVPSPPDFSMRALGYGPNETSGQHQVQTDEGPAENGKQVPAEGVEGPEAEAGDAAAGAGAGEAAAGAIGDIPIPPIP